MAPAFGPETYNIGQRIGMDFKLLRERFPGKEKTPAVARRGLDIEAVSRS